MSTELIDLDDAAPPPKKVKLAGKVYTLPGDIPVALYLQIRQQEASADTDLIDTLHAQLLALFQVHQPQLKVIPIGIMQLVDAVGLIYARKKDDDAARPTRATTGRARTTARRPSKSRSSR